MSIHWDHINLFWKPPIATKSELKNITDVVNYSAVYIIDEPTNIYYFENGEWICQKFIEDKKCSNCGQFID